MCKMAWLVQMKCWSFENPSTWDFDPMFLRHGFLKRNISIKIPNLKKNLFPEYSILLRNILDRNIYPFLLRYLNGLFPFHFFKGKSEPRPVSDCQISAPRSVSNLLRWLPDPLDHIWELSQWATHYDLHLNRRPHRLRLKPVQLKAVAVIVHHPLAAPGRCKGRCRANTLLQVKKNWT